MMKGSDFFHGVQTALATPMLDGEVSYRDLERLVAEQLKEKVDGLVAVGTTGESPTLSDAEHLGVIRRVVEISNGESPVIAGAGSNSTKEALHYSQEAEKAGADALLLVAPYYNRPNQEGLFLHFSKIAEAVRIPILLYSIPSRCGVEIGVETVARLFEKYPHVCGIKEAGGRVERVTALKKLMGDEFAVTSGDDALTLSFMSEGATGVVSVASNVFPGLLKKMVNGFNQDLSTAKAVEARLTPLFEALFVEPNPVPAKFALSELGIISSPEVRLPLAPIAGETKAIVSSVLNALT